MKKRNLPIPTSALAYGETIYWITVLSSFLVIIGIVRSFTDATQLFSPTYMLTAVLEGDPVREIWMNSALQAMPKSHWYFSSLESGEGLMVLGIATGVFSIIPATAIAALLFWRSNNRIFAILAALASLITIVSMVGWISMPI